MPASSNHPTPFPPTPILTGGLFIDSVLPESPIQIATGVDPGFGPAGLVAPTWFLAIHPGSGNDPMDPIDTESLNEAFASYHQDACLHLVEGVHLDQLREELWAHAAADCLEHAECDNGGLYALWDLGAGQVAVMGCDNGGSDIAQFAVAEVLKAHGENSQVQLSACHFSPESYFETGTHEAETVDTEGLALLKRLMPSVLVACPPAPRM